ncbi:uncharacterized protein [Ptychodera flava]|uniref:uncharacterized protein n=1 Tax=Ptychodera flava TaxID=63121 RepID=UPI00396A568F
MGVRKEQHVTCMLILILADAAFSLPPLIIPFFPEYIFPHVLENEVSSDQESSFVQPAIEPTLVVCNCNPPCGRNGDEHSCLTFGSCYISNDGDELLQGCNDISTTIGKCVEEDTLEYGCCNRNMCNDIDALGTALTHGSGSKQGGS